MNTDNFTNVLKKGKPVLGISTDVLATPNQTQVLKRVNAPNAQEPWKEQAFNRMGNEIARTTVASELHLAPPILGEIETPDSLGFIQAHGGDTFYDLQVRNKLTPKQQYLLGHQSARMQRRGLTKGGFLVSDRNPENLVIKQAHKKKPSMRFIDYEVGMPSRAYMDMPNDLKPQAAYPSISSKPFLTGYNLARNFGLCRY